MLMWFQGSIIGLPEITKNGFVRSARTRYRRFSNHVQSIHQGSGSALCNELRFQTRGAAVQSPTVWASRPSCLGPTVGAHLCSQSEPAGRSLCFPDGRGALASHPPHCGYYAATCGSDDSRGNWLEILIDPYEEREPNSLSSHLKIRVRPPGH